MTELLEQAFQHASKLAPQQQDAIAKWLILEIEDDRAWDESFARSANMLNAMAAEALTENNRGDAIPLEPDGL